MVGDIVQQCKEFLWKLATTKSDRKYYRTVANASDEELLSVVEISLNILRGCYKPRRNYMKKLVDDADFVRKLARARTPRAVKRLLREGDQSTLQSLILPVLKECGRYQ